MLYKSNYYTFIYQYPLVYYPMAKQNKPVDHAECSDFVREIRDCLDVINGKWKLPILGSLYNGKKRFKELERDIPKITPRMLAKELRELELNQLISRTVYDTLPVTVEYEITAYGKTLDDVLIALKNWGKNHRKKIIGK